MVRARTTLIATVAATLALAVPATAQALVAQLPADWHEGATLTAWWHDDYLQPASTASINELAGIGAKDAAILTTWYMDTGTSSNIVDDTSRTPDDAAVRAAIEQAHAAGMRVILKPHVDTLNGTFRGSVHPGSPSTWFADYRTMLLHYADMAASEHVDELIIGTELQTMTTPAYTAQWRSLIGEIRAHYGGRLTYASNGLDEANQIGFWDLLDYIGVDAYMPLSSSDPNPSVDSLVAAWHDRGYVQQLTDLSARWSRPLYFTEIGYQAREGTALNPCCDAPGPRSEEAQRRAYEAAFRVWWRVPWFRGFMFWSWPAYPSYNAATNTTWDFRGELAATTASAWWRGIAEVPDDPAPPPPPPPATNPAQPPAVTHARVSLRVRGKRPVRVLGRVQARGHACTGHARVTFYKWHRARRHWHRVAAVTRRVPSTGRFVARAPRLHKGAYRVRARVSSSRCLAPVRTTRFRVGRRHR